MSKSYGVISEFAGPYTRPSALNCRDEKIRTFCYSFICIACRSL